MFATDENRNHCHRKGSIVLWSGILFWLVFANAGLAAEQTLQKKGAPENVHLFGTVEFRSSLKVLPQWKRVMLLAQRQVKEFGQCRGKACSPVAASWQLMVAKNRSRPPMEQLIAVNRFFNKWPYRLDMELFGVSDYWAAPGEFMRLSGDCEDYSIAKYYALKTLGFDIRRLRIVVVKDRIRNIAHAVLAVYLEGTAFILDNLSDLVLEHGKYTHYIPQYSVNEKKRWSHVKPLKNMKKVF